MRTPPGPPPVSLEAGEPEWAPFHPQDTHDLPTTRYNSWQRQTVDAILDGTHTPEVGHLLRRDDNVGLLYPGRTHSIHAESESGKSLIVQYEAARQLNAGESVAYIDFESDLASVTRRLLDLGADPAAIRSRFDYRRPEAPPSPGTPEGAAFAELLTSRYALVILDGVTEALDLLAAKGSGVDINERIASFLRRYPNLIAHHTGAAVVMIDHVARNADTRGRHAIGGQHKMAGLSGAAYTVEVKDQPRRGHTGRLLLHIAKDRPGGIRPSCAAMRADRTQLAATVMIDSTGPGIDVAILAPNPATDTGDTAETWRPTFLMERVSRWLEVHPGKHSRTEITTTVQGKRTALEVALDRLEAEGYVIVTERSRGSIVQRDYAHSRLFTEDDDHQNPNPSHPSQTRPKPVPNPSRDRSQTNPSHPSHPPT